MFYKISDDEDDDLDEPDGKQIGSEYEFHPQFMPNIDQLDSGRYFELQLNNITYILHLRDLSFLSNINRDVSVLSLKCIRCIRSK